MTRVAYVGAVPPLPGGIAQHGGQVVAALRALDVEVTVASWRSQYPTLLHPTRRPPAAEHATGLDGASYDLQWWDPVGWVRAGRALRHHDMLVVPWITALQAPALRAIAHAADLPLVAVVHNPLPHEPQPFVRQLTSWFFRDVAGALGHATACVEMLADMAPGLSSVVVPHPPNLAIAPTPMPSTPPLRLLFFGFVRPYKGVDVLLDAVADLRAARYDVELTVAGQVWGDPADLHAEIVRRGLAQHVDARLGYVADDEVPALLAEHHLVVAPYRSATQSGVVPLASAAARPTVATAVGGLAEQITDGATGTLAQPNDPASLAQAILRAQDRLHGMATAAYWRTPRWEDVARGVLSLVGREPAVPALAGRRRAAV